MDDEASRPRGPWTGVLGPCQYTSPGTPRVHPPVMLPVRTCSATVPPCGTVYMPAPPREVRLVLGLIVLGPVRLVVAPCLTLTRLRLVS